MLCILEYSRFSQDLHVKNPVLLKSALTNVDQAFCVCLYLLPPYKCMLSYHLCKYHLPDDCALWLRVSWIMTANVCSERFMQCLLTSSLQHFAFSLYGYCIVLWTMLREAGAGRLAFLWYVTCVLQCITKTCLYNFDPLKPNFYIGKLGFTGVYIIFLILQKT